MNKMIVIKSIDWIEAHGDSVLLMNADGNRELIRSKRFKRPPDGADIVVGISKQAQEVLGLCYEAWDTSLKMEKHYFDIAAKEQRKMREIKKASLWTRIKWVFTGRVE